MNALSDRIKEIPKVIHEFKRIDDNDIVRFKIYWEGDGVNHAGNELDVRVRLSCSLRELVVKAQAHATRRLERGQRVASNGTDLKNPGPGGNR